MPFVRSLSNLSYPAGVLQTVNNPYGNWYPVNMNLTLMCMPGSILNATIDPEGDGLSVKALRGWIE